MPVFFIASGWLFKGNINSWKKLAKYIARKIKGLWLPHFLFTTLFLLLNNLFLRFNIYTNNPDFVAANISESNWLAEDMTFKTIVKCIINAIFFNTSTILGGALWFFKVLFFLLILYALIDYCINMLTNNQKGKMIIQGIVSVSFLIVGYYCSLHGYSLWDFNKVFSYYILIYIGVLLHHLQTRVHVNRILKACITLIALIVLICSNHFFSSINLADNSYVNPIYLLFVSVVGWCMLYYLADIMTARMNTLSHYIAYVSFRSVPIIGLYFLSFKLVNAIGVIICGYEMYYIAAFPVLFHGWIWILYTIVGIVVPLGIDLIYMLIKNKFKNIIMKKYMFTEKNI